MENKAAYRDWATGRKLPIFLQPWWYDAACGPEGWDVVLARDRDGRILAAWPFRYCTRWGIGRISLPPMTPWSGVLADDLPEDVAVHKANSLQRKYMTELIRQLPPHQLLHQTFCGPAPHPLPLHWKGFREHTSWTHVLSDLQSEEMLWPAMRHNARKNINKGLRQCQVDTAMAPEEFMHFHASVWHARNKAPDLDPWAFLRLATAALKRGCGRIYRARDAQDHTHAALFLLWDHERANVWLSASDPAHHGSGAMYALYWTAIRDHVGSSRCFDFEGGMLQGPETTYAAFGAVRRPLHTYTFTRNRLWATWSLWTGRDYL